MRTGADDHAVVREGLKKLLSTVDELVVSGEAADAEAVHRLLNESPADLLILDLGMPGVSGFQFVAHLRTAWPELRVLVLTANVEPRSVWAAFSAGANGYLTKSGDPCVRRRLAVPHHQPATGDAGGLTALESVFPHQPSRLFNLIVSVSSFGESVIAWHFGVHRSDTIRTDGAHAIAVSLSQRAPDLPL